MMKSNFIISNKQKVENKTGVGFQKAKTQIATIISLCNLSYSTGISEYSINLAPRKAI